VFDRYGAGEPGPNVSSYPLFSRFTTNTCFTGGEAVDAARLAAAVVGAAASTAVTARAAATVPARTARDSGRGMGGVPPAGLGLPGHFPSFPTTQRPPGDERVKERRDTGHTGRRRTLAAPHRIEDPMSLLDHALSVVLAAVLSSTSAVVA